MQSIGSQSDCHNKFDWTLIASLDVVATLMDACCCVFFSFSCPGDCVLLSENFICPPHLVSTVTITFSKLPPMPNKQGKAPLGCFQEHKNHSHSHQTFILQCAVAAPHELMASDHSTPLQLQHSTVSGLSAVQVRRTLKRVT